MNEKLDAKSIDTELLINNIEEMFEINLYTLTSTHQFTSQLRVTLSENIR